ncbi:hypothetical protein ACMFMG_009167 [Clarireedia jacksonii]
MPSVDKWLDKTFDGGEDGRSPRRRDRSVASSNRAPSKVRRHSTVTTYKYDEPDDRDRDRHRHHDRVEVESLGSTLHRSRAPSRKRTEVGETEAKKPDRKYPPTKFSKYKNQIAAMTAPSTAPSTSEYSRPSHRSDSRRRSGSRSRDAEDLENLVQIDDSISCAPSRHESQYTESSERGRGSRSIISDRTSRAPSRHESQYTESSERGRGSRSIISDRTSRAPSRHESQYTESSERGKGSRSIISDRTSRAPSKSRHGRDGSQYTESSAHRTMHTPSTSRPESEFTEGSTWSSTLGSRNDGRTVPYQELPVAPPSTSRHLRRAQPSISARSHAYDPPPSSYVSGASGHPRSSASGASHHTRPSYGGNDYSQTQQQQNLTNINITKNIYVNGAPAPALPAHVPLQRTEPYLPLPRTVPTSGTFTTREVKPDYAKW